jgi:low temperature requirement protein LtrA
MMSTVTQANRASMLRSGGGALFLGGHALFKAVVWRTVPTTRLEGVGVLAALLLLAPHVSALVLTLAALVVIVGVAIADRMQHPAQSADLDRADGAA